eukprot:scaffold1134_cov57-Phaeocystis_antarctica.AAC.2
MTGPGAGEQRAHQEHTRGRRSPVKVVQCWPVQASGDHVLGRRVESACKAVQYLSEYGFT